MERLWAPAAEAVSLGGTWRLLLTDAGAFETPADLPLGEAVEATVPGTVAGALSAAGRFDPASAPSLIERDAWYLRGEPLPAGEAVLRFEGLATIAEVHLDGKLVLTSESMFECHDLPLVLKGGERLAICFRALKPHLERSGPRARWRPRLMSHQGLRLLRTTALGHMPGWCPDIHATGPFRPVSLLRRGGAAIGDLTFRSGLTAEGEGWLSVRFRAEGAGDIRLVCHGAEAVCEAGEDGYRHAELRLNGIEPWFPHTHGDPVLYDVALKIDGTTLPAGRTGFRRIEVDRGEDGKGFALRVNGVPVFCRGAVWTNADLIGLAGDEATYRPLLEKAARAGMNMIRIGGTMTYETRAFFECCDRLGLLVWQDFMFANFDYPVKDEAFVAHVRREAADLLAPLGLSPSLAVLCGGSEIYQQGAMLGLPRTIWEGPLCETILSALAAEWRPDVPYVANSPSGGAMPFAPNEGVTHYYGVGAYERPLDDARRADVRFSAESLAFAQVPAQRTLDVHLGAPAVHDPRWKARVPRDRDASWDFEDTRDHYLKRLYGFDPARLRREDPARYLDFSRAVTGEVSEACFAEWRRSGSRCGGALVWTLSDFLPGPGWGVIDSTGEPKPVYHALKRAFRPLQVLLLDEGTNGIDVHVLHEGAAALTVDLELVCLRQGAMPVVSGRRRLALEGRSIGKIPATDLFGAFFDTAYAFRFGPPSHDVTVARLRDPDTGRVLADAFHFPLGRTAALHAADLEASLVRDEEGWSLRLAANRLAQSVHVECDLYRADDDWFHLAPGETRAVRLSPRAGTDGQALPSGTVHQLGSAAVTAF
ncbi:glycoside hydrolase family 2 protein [Gellertiella hungarica]|uniref:beta-mannosidase n=1 Tax=Gellertiella hungarica TaxID=1572859 RepID=A0A7W6J7S7_9HYPH|nr:glycoside hydrolase family 2 protein [Gellertiella hungarica]MBB4066388.1 beta-mannosidase [Gellertiella hungarica]